MEYVITSERPFEEIEALTRDALERHGFSVQGTFNLQSATGLAGVQEQPGYSVYLLGRCDADRQPLGMLVLYRRGAQTVIQPMVSPAGDADLAAELVGTLVVGDLEMCIGAAGSEKCIDVKQAEEGMRSDGERA